MEGVLLVVGAVGTFLLAAWRMVVRWDPDPRYRGVHERRGRHRHRDWEGPEGE